jgi:hypothetical protein
MAALGLVWRLLLLLGFIQMLLLLSPIDCLDPDLQRAIHICATFRLLFDHVFHLLRQSIDLLQPYGDFVQSHVSLILRLLQHLDELLWDLISIAQVLETSEHLLKRKAGLAGIVGIATDVFVAALVGVVAIWRDFVVVPVRVNVSF